MTPEEDTRAGRSCQGTLTGCHLQLGEGGKAHPARQAALGMASASLPWACHEAGSAALEILVTARQAQRGLIVRVPYLRAVVSLVVFGPKGLADAAKSLGSALRSFAPTLR